MSTSPEMLYQQDPAGVDDDVPNDDTPSDTNDAVTNDDSPVEEEEMEEEMEMEMEEEEEEETSDYSDFSDEENSNSDSSINNSSDSDFDDLPEEEDIKKMSESIEKYHLLSLSIKRTIRELEAKRKDAKMKRDELISQKAIDDIPLWLRRLKYLHKLQEGMKPEDSDQKTLRRLYKQMYQKERYNFIWTLHIERLRIGHKKYNFYTKAGEYSDGFKFVNVVMQNAKKHNIIYSNWDFALLIEQKSSPELFETSRESKLRLCCKIRDTFAKFASIRDKEVLYTE
jgi:hypothetical protein